jgi:hypothetical protein
MFVLFVKCGKVYRLAGRYVSWQEALEAVPNDCHDWQIMPEWEWKRNIAMTGKGK